jgi:hypothetical protein
MATVSRLRRFLSRILVYLTLASRLTSSPTAHAQTKHSVNPGLFLQLERSSSRNRNPRCVEISTIFPFVRMGRIPTQGVAPVVEIGTLSNTVNSTTVNSRTSTGLTSHSLPTGSYNGPATLSRSPHQPFVEWNALQCDGCNTCSSCFCFCCFTCWSCFSCSSCGGCGSCSSCESCAC